MNDRSTIRYKIEVTTGVRTVGCAEVDLHLDSISAGGFAGRTEQEFRVGESVIVHVPIIGDTAGQIVWAATGRIGGRFTSPVDAESVIAELVAF